MVHLRAVSYDDLMDHDSPGATVRQSVEGVIAAFRDSSAQMVNASIEFAREVTEAMTTTRRQTEEAATSSTEMARQAKSSADEARSIADDLKAVSDSILQTVQLERTALQDQVETEKLAMEEQTRQYSARLQDASNLHVTEFQQRIDEAIARLGAEMEQHRQTFEHGLAAMEATEAVASRVHDSVSEVAVAARTAQDAAQRAQQATEQSETYLSSALTAVSAARELASGVMPPTGGSLREPNSGETRDLLGRLEDDYSRLTNLVQKLHERISGLSGPSHDSLVASREPERGSGVAKAGTLVENNVATLDNRHSTTNESTNTEATIGTYQDRFELRIAPVQSFDRLLVLDSALTSIDFVSSVTLGDYEQDQVTFRVEIKETITADDLVRDLTHKLGSAIELTSADDACITIRTV